MAEKKKTDKKEDIGGVFRKLVPGQLAKSLNERVADKLKAAADETKQRKAK